MYRVVIEDKDGNDRYLGNTIYSEKELEYNDELNIIIKEHIIRHPDDKLLMGDTLSERLRNVKILGLVKTTIKDK